MNNIIVRQAVIGDAAEVARVTKDAFAKYAQMAGITTIEALNETIGQVESEIENQHVYVATLNDEIVGSLRIIAGKVSGTGTLTRFGVSNRHQGLGIGGALLDYVDEQIPALGIKELYLHSATKVTSLIKFYSTKGFYILSTTNDREYVRALMVKEY